MLNESHGILTDPEKSFDRLVKLIADYIYDLEGGLNNYINLYPLDEPIITPSILKSYWKYKNNRLFDETIIPKWMGNFIIKIEEHTNQNYVAYYKQDTSILNKNTGKLDFTIGITDKADKSYEIFYKQLTHEFRHAYTDYIKKSTTGNPSSSNYILYKVGVSYAKKYPLISKWGKDYLMINQNVYTDEEYAEAAILKSLYYLSYSEIQSFLQEYAVSVKMVCEKYYDEIIEVFRKTEDLKKNYKNLSKADQWMSNIQNAMPFTCYDFNIFRIYKSLQIFWYNTDRIDLDLLDDIILKNREVFIKLFKTRNIHINVQGDGKKLLGKLAESYKKVLSRIIKKLYTIYYDIIYEYVNSEKNDINLSKNIDKIIKDDIILDYDFELDIMGAMSDIKTKQNKNKIN